METRIDRIKERKTLGFNTKPDMPKSSYSETRKIRWRLSRAESLDRLLLRQESRHLYSM